MWLPKLLAATMLVQYLWHCCAYADLRAAPVNSNLLLQARSVVQARSWAPAGPRMSPEAWHLIPRRPTPNQTPRSRAAAPWAPNWLIPGPVQFSGAVQFFRRAHPIFLQGPSNFSAGPVKFTIQFTIQFSVLGSQTTVQFFKSL